MTRLEKALKIARDFNEDGEPTEYARGQAELLADLFPNGFLVDRAIELAKRFGIKNAEKMYQ